MFCVGQAVRFAGIESVVREVGERDGRVAYLIENGPERLPMWVPGEILSAHQGTRRPETTFHRRTPHMIAVDEFFEDPDEIRALALAQRYVSDVRYYKGLRSDQRFLWPHLREEFGRLLGTPVIEWLGHGANGVFQLTDHRDPLVWHHDGQGYAAAVYLSPDPPPGSGTSFWRDRTYGCRRGPAHPLEQRRLGSEETVRAASAVVYDPGNFERPDNWELVESIAGLYNRLVIWDAKLIHSATSYENFKGSSVASTRLVQLFFFDV
jgi:Family of unknown function (DUF6445)